MPTIAAVQASPIFLDREATLDRVCARIAEAGAAGAKLVVFPESFVPGYPDWVWIIPAGRGAMLGALHAKLLANAVSIPSDATRRIGEAAREAGVIVAVGVTERNDEASGATMYNTLLFFDERGEILGRHRKLVPTGGERLVWAQGDATGLRAYDTSIGRVGGLICWENYMPLARYALYAAGVQIYVAPTWDHGDAWLATLRHIAREGRAFVIGCSIAMRLDQMPPELASLYPPGREWINPGGSAIVAPDGKVLAGPIDCREEILYAEVDLDAARAAKWDLDIAGHYARPDIFDLRVDRTPRRLLNDK
ncbi:MAG: carbon-nitrogen hydrolase family protein [Acidobacteriota bacterium]